MKNFMGAYMDNANQFLSELYKRMDTLNPTYNRGQIEPKAFLDNTIADKFIAEYQSILPDDKNIKILDIGVGEGWFASICVSLGYTNIELADFGCSKKFLNIKNSLEQINDIHDVETSIKDLLSQDQFHNKYDFIHMSHVIEHIPKYDLIDTMDSLNHSLRRNGILFMRTPNLLGPIPFYSLYCTPGHEYGFIPNNLSTLFAISNFSDIKIHNLEIAQKGFAQFFGSIVRRIYLLNAKIKYRAFEGKFPQSVSPELIISGIKSAKQNL